MSKSQLTFAQAARAVLDMKIETPVNSLGGFGPKGEAIFDKHPYACPATLVIHSSRATATFMSNGSTEFLVSHKNGLKVNVLEASFDPVEKRETRVPASNVWIDLSTVETRRVASLINPNFNQGLSSERIRIVKQSNPRRAIWHCAEFHPMADIIVETAVACSLVITRSGPAITREVLVTNRGLAPINGNLWTYYDLHGTQRFVYHKTLWYDMGLPLNACETVNAASMPHEATLQIKRVSSRADHCVAQEATCDYLSFIGDTGNPASLPAAVMQGHLLATGAGQRLNRFSTASISASRFQFSLAPGESASVQQCLLYVEDEPSIGRFLEDLDCDQPGYTPLTQAFSAAAQNLVENTAGIHETLAQRDNLSKVSSTYPAFEITLPFEPVVSAYLNSIWMGMPELYEKCRGHGAQLGDGIELGTRDRCQDMWIKMKEDPAQVRQDLVYTFSFMYVTLEKPIENTTQLSRVQKLHGMFPRQYPSQWRDRNVPVHNDNRPYADSPLWLLNSLNMYIRETGDSSILREIVPSVRLMDPDRPETSAIVGCERTFSLVEVVFEVFAAYKRHVADSPYGLAQILYGDWCDPVDMLGTSVVGDKLTRAMGRGAQIRLSAHLFLCAVETIDTLSGLKDLQSVEKLQFYSHLNALMRFADTLRQAIIRVGWEDGPQDFQAGFIDCIHELRLDGDLPDYQQGETGYTLGSMRGRDFDGVNRRVLTTQAYGIEMLRLKRPYLTEVADSENMIARILKTVDKLFYDPRLGLISFSTAIANTKKAVDHVGRLGIVWSGCAENGEYHHAQMFMHRFRLNIPGQANTVWKQLRSILSTRDEDAGGPFDVPSNSYAADRSDPHFGMGMYFGLSGSIDWIIETIQKIAGIELALHDPTQPDLRIVSNLPEDINETMIYKRMIHKARPQGGYHSIPLKLTIHRTGTGLLQEIQIWINGERKPSAEIWNLDEFSQLEVTLSRYYQLNESH
jgi:hypothetical protein